MLNNCIEKVISTMLNCKINYFLQYCNHLERLPPSPCPRWRNFWKRLFMLYLPFPLGNQGDYLTLTEWLLRSNCHVNSSLQRWEKFTSLGNQVKCHNAMYPESVGLHFWFSIPSIGMISKPSCSLAMFDHFVQSRW